jgi:hypothetical protein
MLGHAFRGGVVVKSIAACFGIFAVWVLATGCGLHQSFSPLNASVNGGSASTQRTPDGSTADDPTADDDSCTRPEASQPGIVRMCHVPAGNPAAKHTICPDLAGAINGHGVDPSKPTQKGGHGGDYLGDC